MRPTVAVVLNIDADHLDCYKDIDEIEETFGTYLHLLPENGIAIGNGDDERVRRQITGLNCRRIFFGTGSENDWYTDQVVEDELGCSAFMLINPCGDPVHIELNIPGTFNRMNAVAAAAAASVLGITPEESAKVLKHFTGAHRRFEKTGEIDGVEIFHDYGHNPTEMKNAVSIARKRCKEKLWAVMQPHTFSRVRTLFDQYLTCTKEADFTLVTDICAAREKDPGDLNSGMLVEGMIRHGINAIWTPSFNDTENYLRNHWSSGDLVLTMGCGDINMLNEQIHRHEQDKAAERK